MRDIAQNKRSKLRGVWNYELREIQTSIGLPFGVIKTVIPRDYFKEGGSPKRDAEDAIGDALGKIKVIYVNTKSKLNLAPTGMVSIAIDMLSPEGAQILARGYVQWPGEESPRGIYVDIGHIIKSNILVQLPKYDNSWLVTWKDLPRGIQADGAVRDIFYNKLPEEVRAQIELHQVEKDIKLDPLTGNEAEGNEENQIPMLEYWDEWRKLTQDKNITRIHPAFIIDNPGDKPTVSHIGRRVDYDNAKHEEAGIKITWPPAFRFPVKRAILKLAEKIGGEEWQVKMKTLTYPGPALSTLVSFPITIKPNQNQPTSLDPDKVAIRVIVTPRKTGKPGPTHPVQVMKMLEDIADVKTVAAIRNTVNVCRPAEKINANVYVFRVICEALSPQQRMNITDPANQTFITKCSLWNKQDELDEIRFDKEVFLVDRELATEPQQMQEPVKQVTTNDTLTTMMQQSLEEALQKGREK